MSDEPRPTCCPSCGSEKIAAILYGLPDFGDDLDAALERGEIVLGGCCVMDGMPLWTCNDCSHRWGNLEFPPSESDAFI